MLKARLTVLLLHQQSLDEQATMPLVQLEQPNKHFTITKTPNFTQMIHALRKIN